MKLHDALRGVCLFAALATLPTSARAGDSASAAACSTGVGCQLPDQKGWAISDDNPNGGLWEAQDNLKVTASGTIQALCWWGVYFDFGTNSDCGPGSGDHFSVTYFNDDACSGVPGSVRAGPLPLLLSSKVATGNVASSSGISMAEFQYAGTHAPVAVTAGECLWIRIVNHTTQDCFWMWSSAHAADGHSALTGVFGTTPQPFDLAFCVDVATASDGCASTLATSYCTAKVNSSGCTPELSARLQGLDLVIDAKQVLAGEVGILFYSIAGPGGGPFQGGFLCATPPVVRTAPQISSATGSPPCPGVYSFNFSAYVASGQDPTLVSGQPVWVQYWTRDSGAVSGSGLTNGLSFSVCH